MSSRTADHEQMAEFSRSSVVLVQSSSSFDCRVSCIVLLSHKHKAGSVALCFQIHAGQRTENTTTQGEHGDREHGYRRIVSIVNTLLMYIRCWVDSSHAGQCASLL